MPSLLLQGLNPGVCGLPVKGWPLTCIDQIRPSLGAQVQKPFLYGGNEFQLLPQQQQQQILAQAHAQGNRCSSIYGDMDPRRFRGLPRGNLNKDGQPMANDDGSIGFADAINFIKNVIEEVMELVELTPLRGALVGLLGVNGLSTRVATIVMRTVRNTVLEEHFYSY